MSTTQTQNDIVEDFKVLEEDFEMTLNYLMEIGEKIVFLLNGKKAWEGTKKDIFNTENQAVSNFVYSSDLFKKVREMYLKK